MTIQPLHTLAACFTALAAAAVVAVVCLRARLLTPGGAAAAALVGGMVFVAGGAGGAAALLAFFVTSNLLGRFRRANKQRLGFEKGGRRDAWQVLANGGLAAVLAAAACLPRAPSVATTLHIMFLAALAEANADTWATEIGAGFGWPPRMMTTFRPALPGESGAVSLPGTLASLAGAAMIGGCAALCGLAHAWLIVTLSGFAGASADSLLGATIQAHYSVPSPETGSARLTERRPASNARAVRGIPGVNNDAVNFLATLIAAASAWLLSTVTR